MTFRNSSQFHLSCNRGFLWFAGDLRPSELQAVPDSEVDETSTGDSRPHSMSEWFVKVQSIFRDSGVDVTEDADVSTNFSGIKTKGSIIFK